MIAAEASLLCFDEFQVNDIADAMILGRLFKALFASGVVVVATCNTAPDDLFAGQPGRDAFLPFIALIKQYLDVLVLQGSRDYRRGGCETLATWHVPADETRRAGAGPGVPRIDRRRSGRRPERLLVMGHTLTVPLAAQGRGPVRFRRALRPGARARRLRGAGHAFPGADPRRRSPPVPENHDAARRFITLVDELYEHRVKLVAQRRGRAGRALRAAARAPPRSGARRRG